MTDKDCSTCKHVSYIGSTELCDKYSTLTFGNKVCPDHEDCIIVDGVDVSDCEFFNAKYEGCHCYNMKEEVYAINPNEQHSCEGVNCNYKKLKRILSKGSLDNE